MATALRPGGRSTWNGTTCTVFGATGFLGKYVVSKLGAIGCRVIIPYRGDEIDTRDLKPCGDLGAINMVPMSIRSQSDIEHAVSGSNVVVNLLGKHYETSRWKFADVNAAFPSLLAEICANQGVERFVHLSALAAAVDSPSAWCRSKAIGEQGVLQAMPSATILRPSLICGDEDRCLNRIAKLSRMLPFFPLVSGGVAKQQPVHVDSVADAVVAALKDPATQGGTYSLTGPKQYSYKELTDIVYKIMSDPAPAVSVPAPIAKVVYGIMGLLPDPWLSTDELHLQTTDNVMPAGVPGLEDLGIAPVDIEVMAERYIIRFRKKSDFIDDDIVIRPPS